jgi:hypothetical protein
MHTCSDGLMGAMRCAHSDDPQLGLEQQYSADIVLQKYHILAFAGTTATTR